MNNQTQHENTVVLIFSSQLSASIRCYVWHPQQIITDFDDGSCQVSFPYQESTNLVGDIMRYMPEVKVVSPTALRNKVIGVLEKGLYLNGNGWECN